MPDSTLPPDDWRKLPRKPAKHRRTRTIAIRVTDSEYAALHSMADQANQAVTDLIICKMLSKTGRR